MKSTGTDCTVETNRKPNTDYTIVAKNDDDKNLLEKSNTTAANLFVDSTKNKRDKSPSTMCQNNNGDITIANDNTVDNSRINTENNSVNKKSENQHSGAAAGGNSIAQSEPNTAAKRQQKTICYDFKKGMCRRRFCRYPHVMNTDQVIFCHDFQNTGCFRANCRFIHRSIEDEEHYRTYGVFSVPAERPPMPPAPPANLNQSEHHMAQQQCPPPLPQPPTVHPHPSSHLNYYHDNNMMISQQQQQQQQQQQSNPSAPIFSQNSAMPLTLAHRRRSFGMIDGHMDTTIPSKRPHMDEIRLPTVSTPNYSANGDNSHGCRFIEQNIVGGQPVNGPQSQPPPPQQQQQQQQQQQPQQLPPSTQTTGTSNSVAAQVQSQPPPQVASVVIAEDVINIYRLYEEHNLLRRRVEINEERLQELRATNSYLLQQNEQLRRQTQCSCANTIVSPVTLTTASQQSAAPVLNAVSIAPVQVQATPIVSIASIGQPQTQIITSSTPLAIAANTTQGQQLALASTQQAGQILGTPQITLAAPSMGMTMTSQPLAMSANATQPIISYPVMTHSILPH